MMGCWAVYPGQHRNGEVLPPPTYFEGTEHELLAAFYGSPLVVEGRRLRPEPESVPDGEDAVLGEQIGPAPGGPQ